MQPFLLSLATTVAALAGVLALAYLALRLLRGRLAAPGGRAGADAETLRFVRALPLGAKERVVLIEHRGERWMLGVTAGGISVLARWPGEAPAAPTPDAAPAEAAAPADWGRP